MKYLLTILLCFFTVTTSFAFDTDTLVTASGIKYFFLSKGNGPALTPGWIAIWQYELTLTNGKKIDASRDRDAPFAAKYPSDQIIKGVTEALSLMHIGDRAIFIIPPSLGYGEKGAAPMIPPNATLIFDMELIGMKEKSLQSFLDSVLFAKNLTDSAKPRMKEAKEVYEKLKKQQFSNLYYSENDLNNIGYQLIKKYPGDALEIFKWNVELYPKSWNVYDSIGECYMALGETSLAIKNYEKSVELNPNNQNGVETLKKLKANISTM